MSGYLTSAQEVVIRDPGLDAALREALQKHNGPLTGQDLLSLTNLNARHWNVATIEGLEAAQNLVSLDLSSNRLTYFSIPSALTRLETLNVGFNFLTNCTLPNGLTNLTALILNSNQLTTLTLPPDLAQLNSLVLNGNPLATLVLPEPLADTNLAGSVSTLRNQGVVVFTYPLTIQLSRLQEPAGAFQFVVSGPPGTYTVLASADVAAWNPLRVSTNELGKVVFTDGTAHLSQQKYYRAVRQTAPTNMVFILPNTFTMGSPNNEAVRNINEGPEVFNGPSATIGASAGVGAGAGVDVSNIGEHNSLDTLNFNLYVGLKDVVTPYVLPLEGHIMESHTIGQSISIQEIGQKLGTTAERILNGIQSFFGMGPAAQPKPSQPIKP